LSLVFQSRRAEHRPCRRRQSAHADKPSATVVARGGRHRDARRQRGFYADP
jgi:hypothetical protein